MRLGSYNIRGIGGQAKNKDVKQLISNQKLDMLCLQDTKTDSFTRNVCVAMWGDEEVEWVSKPAVGSSGGILTMWNRSVFSLHATWLGSNFIGVRGCGAVKECWFAFLTCTDLVIFGGRGTCGQRFYV